MLKIDYLSVRHVHLGYLAISFCLLTCGSSVALGQASCIDKLLYNKHIHPSLYVTPKRFSEIKSELQKGNLTPYWDYTKKLSDRTINSLKNNPSLHINRLNIREISDKIPYLLMTYKITGANKYREYARKIIDRYLSMDEWVNDKDIEAAHVIFNLSLYYDWMHDEMEEEFRNKLRRKITHHSNIIYEELVRGKIWWTREHSLLQNHNYINTMSIAIAGIALLDEEERALKWINAAEQNFSKVNQLLSLDGASHEGVGYWSYGMDALLKYMEGVNCQDRSISYQNPYFANAITYRLQMTIPGFIKTANYSDSPERDYKGPGYILRLLANKYNDGRGIWLANNIEANRDRNVYSWLDLVWMSKVKPEPPDKTEKTHLFDNLGIVVSRSGWEEDDSWLMFKAGPYQGKQAYLKEIYPGSHPHPDAGHISIWSNGEWLLNDEGYSPFKLTGNHNTVIFDRKGQVGENSKWFDRKPAEALKIHSEILEYENQGKSFNVKANLTEMYPPSLKIKRFERSLFLLENDNLIVRDHINVDGVVTVDSLFHTQKDVQLLGKGSVCLGQDAVLTVFSDIPLQLSLSAYNIPVKERRDNKGIYTGQLIRIYGKVADQLVVTYELSKTTSGCASKEFKNQISKPDSTYSLHANEFNNRGIALPAGLLH